MAITPRKSKMTAEDFINQAPDAIPATLRQAAVAISEPAPVEAVREESTTLPQPSAVPSQEPTTAAIPTLAGKKTQRTIGNKSILSVSMSPELVRQLDTWASERGLSRAAALALATSRLIKES